MIATDKARKKTARTARLSAALRENLKRRKAQARERKQVGDRAPNEKTPPDNAGARVPDFRRNRGAD
jgi:hypothetical protein